MEFHERHGLVLRGGRSGDDFWSYIPTGGRACKIRVSPAAESRSVDCARSGRLTCNFIVQAHSSRCGPALDAGAVRSRLFVGADFFWQALMRTCIVYFCTMSFCCAVLSWSRSCERIVRERWARLLLRSGSS